MGRLNCDRCFLNQRAQLRFRITEWKLRQRFHNSKVEGETGAGVLPLVMAGVRKAFLMSRRWLCVSIIAGSQVWVCLIYFNTVAFLFCSHNCKIDFLACVVHYSPANKLKCAELKHETLQVLISFRYISYNMGDRLSIEFFRKLRSCWPVFRHSALTALVILLSLISIFKVLYPLSIKGLSWATLIC